MSLGSTGSSEDKDNILMHCMEVGGTRRSWDADRTSEVEFPKMREIWGRGGRTDLGERPLVLLRNELHRRHRRLWS